LSVAIGTAPAPFFLFRDAVEFPLAGDGFLIDDGVADVVAQAEPNPAAGPRTDKAIHGTRIKRVFPINKFRQQQYIALLWGMESRQVIEAFPMLKISCAHDARRRNGRRQAGRRRILALGAEHTVDPAVFMLRQAHVVNIGFLRAGIRQDNRMIPKAEPLNRTVTFRDAEKRFPVRPLDAGDEIKLPIEFERAGIERCIYAEAFHKIRIGTGIQIVFPIQRDMIPCQDGVFPPRENTVVKIPRFIRLRKEAFLFFFQTVVFLMEH
jgi:hypothetical protein